LKPLIIVAAFAVLLSGCGTAAEIKARNEMLGNSGGEAVSLDTDVPAEFFIPGTDQPLATWVQNQRTLEFSHWQILPNVAPPLVARSWGGVSPPSAQQASDDTSDEAYLQKAWAQGTSAEQKFGMAPGQGLVKAVPAEATASKDSGDGT
jgi:hypothetical protein